MSTQRRIYQGKAVYVGPTGVSSSGLIKQLHRVQSANHNFNITRTDVNQFGQLAAVSREIIEQPKVGLDISYLSVDATNEHNLGFVTDGSESAIANMMTGNASNSYYIAYAPEGTDAIGATGDANFRNAAVGNGFISQYAAQGAVGGLPSVSVTIEAMNVASNPNVTGLVPTIDPTNGIANATLTYALPTAVSGVAGQVSTLRPGDITVTITSSNSVVGIGADINDAKIQSYNISYALTRENLSKLGTRFSYARPIKFPATASCAIKAIVGDLVGGTSLAAILCDDATYDISVSIKEPSCDGNGQVAIIYSLDGAKLDTQGLNESIGPNDEVDLNFSAQIGGPNDVTHGVFISGLVR